MIERVNALGLGMTSILWTSGLDPAHESADMELLGFFEQESVHTKLNARKAEKWRHGWTSENA